MHLQPSPMRDWTSGADLSAFLNSLAQLPSKKGLVLLFADGEALSMLSDELRAEFLSVLRSQRARHAPGSADPSEGPVTVRMAP